jgi:hypothetical protein
VFGAWDEKAGAAGSVYDVLRDRRLPVRAEVVGGILEDDARAAAHLLRRPPLTRSPAQSEELRMIASVGGAGRPDGRCSRCSPAGRGGTPRALQVRRVADALEDHFGDGASRRAVGIQHVAGLRHHLLRGCGLGARPPRDHPRAPRWLMSKNEASETIASAEPRTQRTGGLG